MSLSPWWFYDNCHTSIQPDTVFRKAKMSIGLSNNRTWVWPSAPTAIKLMVMTGRAFLLRQNILLYSSCFFGIWALCMLLSSFFFYATFNGKKCVYCPYLYAVLFRSFCFIHFINTYSFFWIARIGTVFILLFVKAAKKNILARLPVW